jgi:hypothetical protein
MTKIKVILNLVMLFADENQYKVHPLCEANCLSTEHHLDFVRHLNLSGNQNEPSDSRLNVGLRYFKSFDVVYN